jgi:hypothetical protein
VCLDEKDLLRFLVVFPPFAPIYPLIETAIQWGKTLPVGLASVCLNMDALLWETFDPKNAKVARSMTRESEKVMERLYTPADFKNKNYDVMENATYSGCVMFEWYVTRSHRMCVCVCIHVCSRFLSSLCLQLFPLALKTLLTIARRHCNRVYIVPFCVEHTHLTIAQRHFYYARSIGGSAAWAFPFSSSSASCSASTKA